MCNVTDPAVSLHNKPRLIIVIELSLRHALVKHHLHQRKLARIGVLCTAAQSYPV